MRKSLTDQEAFNLYVLLRNTNDTIYRVRTKELNKLGISGRHGAILRVIRMIEAQGIVPTASEISRWLVRKPHTISDTVKRMEKEGLIRKARKNQKNILRIIMTPRGQEYLDRSNKIESISKVFSQISRKESQQLKFPLEKLRDEGRNQLGIEQKIPWP